MQEIRTPLYKDASDGTVKTNDNADITLKEVEKCVF